MSETDQTGIKIKWRGEGTLIENVGKLVVRGQHQKALDYLNKIINDYMPLFQEEEWVKKERRRAWLYRIGLLRELGRSTEALAWVCLEVELNPENVAAQALKERLKREAGLLPNRDKESNNPNTYKPELSIWNGVAGMRELKAMLERDVILPLQEPELYEKYCLDIPNGILLYGPPGCGKTYIARKLGEILKFAFKEIKPGDLSSIYVHGTQGKIHELFRQAHEHIPCMLFFDEIDAMVPKRSDNSVGHHYASEVDEFSVHLNNCGEDGILVVGATNRPEQIDEAILRPGRIDKKFFVAPPDYEARIELLKLYMHNRPQDKIDWNRCAIELEGYTCAEIKNIVIEATRHASEQNKLITNGDILYAAGMNSPQFTKESIEKMKNFG